jgi:hypothetical protein
MLLAPFTLADASVRQPTRRGNDVRLLPPWLLVWAIGGLISVALFPSLRGGMATGMSVPFWLVAAPLINILWLTRRRWLGQLRAGLTPSLVAPAQRNRRGRQTSIRDAQPRVPRRLRSILRRNSDMMRR